MKALFLQAILFLSCVPFAFAEPYKPGATEKAPEKVECSWSKMKKQQYADCQKRKKFFESMTPEERKKFNDEVESKQMKKRVERLERVTPGVPVQGDR